MSTEHPVVAAQAPVDKPQPSTAVSTERPTTPPSTRFPHKSSPIMKGPFYKREQVQRYGHQKETHQKEDFENADDLFKFLGIPTFDGLPPVNFNIPVRQSDFLEKANSMSKSIKEKYFNNPPSGLVVLKDTENKVPRGHVTDTKCRPDITAAFDDDFRGNDTTVWPRIRMAGEWASKGTAAEEQELKAISYLHYLLLARPDLYVAQGMLASEKSMTFLVGIGGYGIRSLKISWSDKEFAKLLYAFIYRTYDPDHFADPSYKLDPIGDEDSRPTWTITLGVKSQVGGVIREVSIPCPNFLPLYASSPFETRTHVFATTGEAVIVDEKKRLTVLKDQVCQLGNRFNEYEILELVHQPKNVPGVVEAVYHDCMKLPSQLDDLHNRRVKHRHGLRQLGSPFASIPTVKEMLQVAFDSIEVLRFLRAKRNILHRDISPGNIMYTPPSKDKQNLDTSKQRDEVLYFSEYFLSDGTESPQTTSSLLVDFNHAEHLTSKTDDRHHEQVERTGTAVFMARAVELGRPMDVPDFFPFLGPIPPPPKPYAKHYESTRLRNFPHNERKGFTKAENSAPQAWRHELDHDIESVFWLMLYWAMTVQPAQPKGGPIEHIAISSWARLTESAVARDGLIDIIFRGKIEEGTFHSTFRPLNDLFRRLAEVLSSVDRHWLPTSEMRNDPEYFAEAFQRLILQFLIDHKDNNSFMNQKIDSNPREPEQLFIQVPWSSTTNQRSRTVSQGKRQASNTAEQPEHKRCRTTQESEVDQNSKS